MVVFLGNVTFNSISFVLAWYFHHYIDELNICKILIASLFLNQLDWLELYSYKKINEIKQKIFNQKYCNVGMTQQRSLAKMDKKSDVGMVTG